MCSRIQSRCRLIKNEYRWTHSDDSRYRYSPLLTSAQLERRRVAYLIIVKSDDAQRRSDPDIYLLFRQSDVARSISYVLGYGLFEQLILRILEDESDFAPYIYEFCLAVSNALSVDIDFA